MHSTLSNLLKVIIVSVLIALPTMSWSNTIEEKPSALAMTGDALFVRPVMLVTTAVGSAIFIVSSPFAILGGNISETWEQLVWNPFRTTFVRCLGCTMNGRKSTTVIKSVED